MSSSQLRPTIHVLVSDSSGTREVVERVISACDVQASAYPYASAAGARVSLHNSVVLVALVAGASPHADWLNRVRDASASGASVIAYAEAASSWPVGRRCEVLLAGALLLLDSASSEFANALEARLTQLLAALLRRRDELELTRETMSARGLVGCSAAILNVFRLTLKVAPLSDLPVLVSGETGTGKELLARAIHDLDPKRSCGPFVAVNCAALTKSLAESELFGHRRGAFTGADRDRKGLIRAADGGVLFLDEVAELDVELQGKLLRVLQEGRVLSVGQDQEAPVSVRIVGATHRDLAERVRMGVFREDLFYRLNVLPIRIPPLRERPDDVPLLVEHFQEKHRVLRPSLRVAPSQDFLEALAGIPLPGNARQLENLVRHALAEKENDLPLELSDLPREVLEQLLVATSTAPSAPASPVQGNPTAILDSNDWKLARLLAEAERMFLRAALDRTGGNQSRTARLLGITPRSIYTKLRKYQLHP